MVMAWCSDRQNPARKVYTIYLPFDHAYPLLTWLTTPRSAALGLHWYPINFYSSSEEDAEAQVYIRDNENLCWAPGEVEKGRDALQRWISEIPKACISVFFFAKKQTVSYNVDGRRWTSMVVDDSMDVDGRRWTSMGVDGRQWTSMDVEGCRWMSMDVDGRRRPSLSEKR